MNFLWPVLKWIFVAFLQVGNPLQSPVPGSNLSYSFPFGFQQPPPGGASGPGSRGAPGLWGNPRPHVSSFPLRHELQQYEPYSPVRGFPVADRMAFSSDSYIMDSAEWGLKQSHIHDKPKVFSITLQFLVLFTVTRSFLVCFCRGNLWFFLHFVTLCVNSIKGMHSTHFKMVRKTMQKN